MDSNWQGHLDSIAETIADYRLGDIPARSPVMVERWVAQFPSPSRAALLGALDRTLKRSFISRRRLGALLENIAATDFRPGTNDALSFWRSANVLDIQIGGSSQREVTTLFADVVSRIHGIDIFRPETRGAPYVYLDDIIATGTRLRQDLRAWLQGGAPNRAIVYAIAPVVCASAYWVEERLNKDLQGTGTSIRLILQPARGRLVETRKHYRNSSDTLWPTAIPDDPATLAYCEALRQEGYPPVLREPGNSGLMGFFASDSDKKIIEEAFLTRGCHIVSNSESLPETHRPLGYNTLATLGMGLMAIPYRNCPNSAPLALWVASPGHPALLPRRTNRESAE